MLVSYLAYSSNFNICSSEMSVDFQRTIARCSAETGSIHIDPEIKQYSAGLEVRPTGHSTRKSGLILTRYKEAKPVLRSSALKMDVTALWRRTTWNRRTKCLQAVGTEQYSNSFVVPTFRGPISLSFSHYRLFKYMNTDKSKLGSQRNWEYFGFEILAAVTKKSSIFCDVTPCSLLNVC
jgi:hypothetical protein